MAIVIQHGHNGSYKTASCVWFDILPALRAGRVVVTNVAGLYPLDQISAFLGETFPDTARLYRVFSQSPKGQELWKRWFHWMPIGALVVIDECQDIYDVDVFHPRYYESLNYPEAGIDFYSEVLPPDLISYYKEQIERYTPDSFEPCDSDDTGQRLFDVDGRIIYPNTARESFMRHRHYNWDVILLTPDITEINTSIRKCCEKAFNYESKDSFIFSRRKPRIFEHNPSSNGIPSKTDSTFSRRVPVSVHMLYKSTQTGRAGRSGVSKGPLATAKGKFVFFVVCPAAFLYSAYSVWSWSTARDVAAAASSGSEVAASVAGARDPVGTARDGAPRVNVADFVMPYGSSGVHIVGSSGVRRDGQWRYHIIFSAKQGDDEIQFTSDDLADIGYAVDRLGDCSVVLTDTSTWTVTKVFCAPRRVQQPPPKQQREMPQNVQQLASLGLPLGSG